MDSDSKDKLKTCIYVIENIYRAHEEDGFNELIPSWHSALVKCLEYLKKQKKTEIVSTYIDYAEYLLKDMQLLELHKFTSDSSKISSEKVSICDLSNQHTTMQDKEKKLIHRSSDGTFDLDKIPMEVLDRAYSYYIKYMTNLGHNAKPGHSRMAEDVSYSDKAKNAATAVSERFNIGESLFKILEADNKIYVYCLISYLPGNMESVEKIMEMNGFLRTQNTREEIICDGIERKWATMQFELTEEGDVTEEFKNIGNNIAYHLSPTELEERINEDGLVPSDNAASEDGKPRTYIIKGNTHIGKIRCLASNLASECTLYSINLKKLGYNFRFYRDNNDEAIAFTNAPIPSSVISVKMRLKVGTETAHINIQNSAESLFSTDVWNICILSNDCMPPRLHVMRDGWDVCFSIETGETLEIISKGKDDKLYDYMVSNIVRWLDSPNALMPAITNRQNAMATWRQIRE